MLTLDKLAPSTSRPMRLLIVDKEPLVRSELAQLCLRITDLHVIGEADSGGAAIDAAKCLSPDVMLIDVALPDMSGFEVLRGAGVIAASWHHDLTPDRVSSSAPLLKEPSII